MIKIIIIIIIIIVIPNRPIFAFCENDNILGNRKYHSGWYPPVMFVGLYPSLAMAITPVQQSLELCATSRTLGHLFELGFHGYLSFTQLGKWLSSPLWNTKWKNPTRSWACPELGHSTLKNAEEHQPIHGLKKGDTTGSNWIYMIYHRQDMFVCPERIYPQHGHQNGETDGHPFFRQCHFELHQVMLIVSTIQPAVRENQGNLETNRISFGSCSRSVSKIRQKKTPFNWSRLFRL